jgi:hypothetical protein
MAGVPPPSAAHVAGGRPGIAVFMGGRARRGDRMVSSATDPRARELRRAPVRSEAEAKPAACLRADSQPALEVPPQARLQASGGRRASARARARTSSRGRRCQRAPQHEGVAANEEGSRKHGDRRRRARAKPRSISASEGGSRPRRVARAWRLSNEASRAVSEVHRCGLALIWSASASGTASASFSSAVGNETDPRSVAVAVDGTETSPGPHRSDISRRLRQGQPHG